MSAAPSRSVRARRNAFIERLAYYLIGIAIGLFLLGLMWKARAAAARNQPPAGQAAPITTTP